MIVIDVLSWLAIGAGVLFLLVGGIGIIRLPDFYTRCHAAGVTDTGATSLIILGLMLQAGLSMVTVKLALILLFLLFTSPTATHAVAHAAFTGGVRPQPTPDTADTSEETPS
ncbi:MAG: monovalent cation/H(+) antiporter subunit G [Rhodospirillales bacterium]